MKEIVVISGKGGTGKTSLAASFSVLGGAEIVTADCDVDAADMHLLLEPDFSQTEDFHSGFLAYIDQDRCSSCGNCKGVCRFKAVAVLEGQHKILPLECEGCGYCARVCPTGAIKMTERAVGKWYSSRIKTGGTMIHAKLDVGGENSGKLVAKVKTEAKKSAQREGKGIVLVDGSPGIGCPVVSSLTGADFVLFVTEPTVSGFHDLGRVHSLVKRFGIQSGCIINKADLNPEIAEQTMDFLKQEKILPIALLPYDENFTKAMVMGKTIVEHAPEGLGKLVSEAWGNITEIIEEKGE